MKIQFDPNLDFQREAIDSIVDIFQGQEICQTNFTVAPLKKEVGFLPGLDQNDLGTIAKWPRFFLIADSSAPTAVESSTWGSVKALYQ